MTKCPRCDIEYSWLEDARWPERRELHDDQCPKVPTPKELAEQFWEDPSLNHVNMSEMYDTQQWFMISRLKRGKVKGGEQDFRLFMCKIVDILGYKTIDEVPRCDLCKIMIVEEDRELPDGWYRDVNGKCGIWCAGCAKDIQRKIRQAKPSWLYRLP